MKKAFAFAVAMAAATPALAVDLPLPGLALNTEVKLNHAVDAEATTLSFNPEVAWEPMVDGPLTLTAGATITAYDSTAGATFGDDIVLFDALDDGSRPAIELGVTYALPVEGAEMFAETEWDVNKKERSEINVGVSFNF